MYNRYLYQLRYINKRSRQHRKISWRCVDYNKNKCRAHIFTNDNDEVVERTFRHNHTFHDKNILRKHRKGTVYSRFQDAKLGAEMNQKVQYTMSNQGGLQVIHNRYVYSLRYCGKKNQRKFWRCVDYSTNLKCAANICTNDYNQVTERNHSHNHGFHDNKILKKLQNRNIYSIFREAENKASAKKKERLVTTTVGADDSCDE